MFYVGKQHIMQLLTNKGKIYFAIRNMNGLNHILNYKMSYYLSHEKKKHQETAPSHRHDFQSNNREIKVLV